MYEKLAKLKKQSSSTERILHRPIVLTSNDSNYGWELLYSSFSFHDKMLQVIIHWLLEIWKIWLTNRSTSHRSAMFSVQLKVPIQNTNCTWSKRNRLDAILISAFELSSGELRTTLAEKSFKIIGKQIKDRRMADFNDIMRSRLPEDFKYEKSSDNRSFSHLIIF